MRRHSTDAISLAFGLIFVGIAGWWLVGRYVEVEIPNLGWIAAGALIVLGLLGVAASLRRDRSTLDAGPAARTEPTEPMEPTEGQAGSPAAPDPGAT